MIIVVFGPPGVGKGTQSAKLSAHLGIPAFSTGDMFRAAMVEDSPLGQKIRSFMDAGDLVPDEVVNELVASRMVQPDCADGLILDGYPRTVAQVKVLEGWLAGRKMKLDYVIELVVDREELVKRLAGRLYAPTSKKTYHEKYAPPRVPGKCNITGEDLIHRDDDKPEVVRHRFDVYTKNTQPVLDYFAADGRLSRIDGMKNIDEVYADILKVVEK
ncbi:MAG: adenylate kinase [Pseudomonadaceae bacterium]|nr:adenylate kinase [Pseudomonadaceae bacterium]